MGKMRINPVADMMEKFLRLNSLEDDAVACLGCSFGWESRYEDKMDASLKQGEDKRISKMRTDLEAYP